MLGIILNNSSTIQSTSNPPPHLTLKSFKELRKQVEITAENEERS